MVGSRKSFEGEAGEIELRLVELFETAAEVDEHQVALVAEHGEQGALASFGGALERGEGVGRLVQDLGAGGVGECAPGGAAEAHHLVQHAGAFDTQGDGRHSGSGKRVWDHLSIIGWGGRGSKKRRDARSWRRVKTVRFP